MPACRSWLGSELKEVLQAVGGSSKDRPVSVARQDCSQPSPMEHTSNTRLRELGASMGCVCELLCVWEALWERSVEAPAACSWVGGRQAAGTADEEGGRGRERSLGAVKVSCQCQELWRVICLGPSLPRFSRSLPVPVSVSFLGSLAPQSFLLFCQHYPVSCRLLRFLSVSLPFWLPTCYCFNLPTQPSSPFLGKIALLSLPLPSDLCLYSVTASALHRSLLRCPFPQAVYPAPSPHI